MFFRLETRITLSLVDAVIFDTVWDPVPKDPHMRESFGRHESECLDLTCALECH